MSGLQLDDLEELLRIAREYERMGRFRDAAVAYDQALVLFRDDKRAKEGLRRSGKIEYVRRDMRHRKGMMFIDWSPDSRYLLTASSDGVVNIWNVESERIVRVYKTAYVLSAVDWSVDGKYIAMGEKRGMVVIRDAFTGRKIAELDYEDELNHVAWSPDGRYVAAGGFSEAVCIWAVEKVKKVAELPCRLPDEFGVFYGYVVYAVVWSPNGRYLVSGSEDCFLRLWDVQTGDLIAKVEEEDCCVNLIAWSPNSKYIVTGSWGKIVKVWTGKKLLLKRIIRFEDDVLSFSWSPDGRLLACGLSNGVIEVWDPQRGEKVMILGSEGERVFSLSWSPDGRYLASGNSQGMVDIWDIENGDKVTFWINEGHDKLIVDAAISSRGDYIVSVALNDSIRIWDGKTGKELFILPYHEVRYVSWSPDDKLLAIRLDDGIIQIWDIEKRDFIAILAGNTYTAGPCWSPNGKNMAVGTREGTIEIWNVKGWDTIKILTGHRALVMDVSWSPNDRYIASLADDNTIKIWDVERGREVSRLKVGKEAKTILWSGDGQYVVINKFTDKSVGIWDWRRDSIVEVEEDDLIDSVACSPCGKYVALAVSDVIKIWSIKEHKAISTIETQGAITNIVWRESDRIFVSTVNGDFLYAYPFA